MNNNQPPLDQGYGHSHPHSQQHQQPTYPGGPPPPPPLQQQQHQQHLQNTQPYPNSISGGPVHPAIPYHAHYPQQQQQLPAPHNLNHHQLPHLTQMPMGPTMSGMPNPVAHPMNNMSMNGVSGMAGMGAHMGMPGHIMPQQSQQLRSNPLESVSLTRHGKSYSLEVLQQPVRARMCGFGDKDRRPITPPPCVKLVIRDLASGEILEPTEDANHFVLLVDLWNSDGTQEVSLVRHSNTSPAISISAATTTPYPPPPERPYLGMLQPGELYSYHMSGGNVAMYRNPGPPGYPQQHPGQPGQVQHPGYGATPSVPIPVMPMPSNGMFTKNLIGSLCANATRLNDTKGKPGYWFILQDLLKLSFIDISPSEGSNEPVNKSKVPVLASTFTDIFQVYSAKKFPGVIESTELSKCFAGQGIKIPIRKDGNSKNQINVEEYENDEQ
ncbi:hypothetical protein FKW77_001053 [Venturia effusa]|uniref:Velvet domain-containing protein n=1 Tax=Venturia effusa TaxID=50376 RepID=A0A517KVS1_9PEZI|nr:hypothetical protein FKW77_001053 [Venturia effusa]